MATCSLEAPAFLASRSRSPHRPLCLLRAFFQRQRFHVLPGRSARFCDLTSLRRAPTATGLGALGGATAGAAPWRRCWIEPEA